MSDLRAGSASGLNDHAGTAAHPDAGTDPDANGIMMPTTMPPTVMMMIGGSSIGIDIGIDADVGMTDMPIIGMTMRATRARS